MYVSNPRSLGIKVGKISVSHSTWFINRRDFAVIIVGYTLGLKLRNVLNALISVTVKDVINNM